MTHSLAPGTHTSWEAPIGSGAYSGCTPPCSGHGDGFISLPQVCGSSSLSEALSTTPVELAEFLALLTDPLLCSSPRTCSLGPPRVSPRDGGLGNPRVCSVLGNASLKRQKKNSKENVCGWKLLMLDHVPWTNFSSEHNCVSLGFVCEGLQAKRMLVSPQQLISCGWWQ